MNKESNIDELAKRLIPYFDDYCNNLITIEDNKSIEFNKISYNTDIKLKNVTNNKCFVYSYLENEITYKKLYLDNKKVLFGYNQNGVQVYFDNYFNISLCIKDILNIYIERNTESFPLICFYSGKFNFKGRLFDYDINKNLINNIIILLSKYENDFIRNKEFSNHLKVLLNLYFESDSIPKFTKSYSNIRDYMCSYKYLCYKLNKLKEFYNMISNNYGSKVLNKKIVDLKEIIDKLKDIQVKKSKQNKDLERFILDKDDELKIRNKLILDKDNELKLEQKLIKKNNKSSKKIVTELLKDNKYYKLLNLRLKLLMIFLITILSLVMYILFIETPHVYHMYYHKSKVLSNNILNISFSLFNTSYHYLEDVFSDLNNVTISHYLDNPDYFDM
jgi:hypothetical protein